METGASLYDLIVIGGGPAGSAASITAARAGARVLLLEKDQFPRHKVCGEFVSAESLGLLRSLTGKTDFQGKPAITNGRLFVGNRRVGFQLSQAAMSIPRFDLDAALFHAAEAQGVHAIQGSYAREVLRNETFHVITPEQSYKAKAVVNATGRWSNLGSRSAAPRSKWIGLKAHFREALAGPSVDLYFFSGGYCGVQQVGTDRINVCAMVKAEAARSLAEVVSLHPELWKRSRDWDPLFPALTTSGLLFRRPETQFQHMMLVGDAAGFIDPFAGDGISLALHSGALAAEALLPFLGGKDTLDEVHSSYAKRYRRRFSAAFRNARGMRMVLSAPEWIRFTAMRIAGLKPVARALVSSTRAK